MSCLQAIIKITPSYLSLSDDEKEIQNKFYVLLRSKETAREASCRCAARILIDLKF